MNYAVAIDNRIKQMLVKDKKINPEKIVKLLKSEIFFSLRNYMEIKVDDINLDIGIDNDGKYIISLNATSNRLYLTNYLM